MIDRTLKRVFSRAAVVHQQLAMKSDESLDATRNFIAILATIPNTHLPGNGKSSICSSCPYIFTKGIGFSFVEVPVARGVCFLKHQTWSPTMPKAYTSQVLWAFQLGIPRQDQFLGDLVSYGDFGMNKGSTGWSKGGPARNNGYPSFYQPILKIFEVLRWPFFASILDKKNWDWDQCKTWVDNLRNMGKKCMSAIKYKILRVWWCIIFISQSRMWFSRHTHVLAWQVREGGEGSLCQPLSMCMIQIWPKRPWCPICRCTDMMPINTQRHIHVCAHLHIIYMYVTYVGISA